MEISSKQRRKGWNFTGRMERWKFRWNVEDLSNPVELAEYAIINQVQEEPAFKWWVANVMRREIESFQN
jgi:hypothetical protein